MEAVTKRKFSDLDVQALIDNELDWERTKEVRDFINSSYHAKSNYNKWYEQKKMVQLWWKNFGG